MRPSSTVVYFCGALTSRGKYCQIPVSAPGQRCRHHPSSTAPEKLWPKIYRLCERVATLTGAAFGVVEVSKAVWPYLQQLGGLLMPEDFWHGGLQQASSLSGSHAQRSQFVRDAFTRISTRQDRLLAKLRSYSAADRARLLGAIDAATAALRDLETAKRA
jgi:hypothetical protein